MMGVMGTDPRSSFSPWLSLVFVILVFFLLVFFLLLSGAVSVKSSNRFLVLFHHQILQPFVFHFKLIDPLFQARVFVLELADSALEILLSLLLLDSKPCAGCRVSSSFVLSCCHRCMWIAWRLYQCVMSYTYVPLRALVNTPGDETLRGDK